MVYLDIHGHVKFDASPTIRFALQDIFTGEVCQRFVKAAAAARKGQGWRPAQSGQQYLAKSPIRRVLTARQALRKT